MEPEVTVNKEIPLLGILATTPFQYRGVVNRATGATANRRKLDLRSGEPGTRAVMGNVEYRGGYEANLGTRWVADRWCEPRRFAWEADVLPLNDTREKFGFRRFYSQRV